MFYKTEQITIRVNPILKDKFTVALGFRSFADFFTAEMQKLVRDYEKQIGQAIPVRTDKQGRYDLITHIYGVKITEEEYDELLALFPKTRKDIALYGD